MVFSVTDDCHDVSPDEGQEQFACRPVFRALVYLLRHALLWVRSQWATINVSRLWTFNPDVSNNEFRGCVHTNPQVHLSRLENRVIPLGQIATNQPLSRVPDFRETPPPVTWWFGPLQRSCLAAVSTLSPAPFHVDMRISA